MCSTQAQVYRWTDENGKVHFSDKAPREQQHEEISEQLRHKNIEESAEETAKLSKIFAPKTAEEKHFEEQQRIAQQQQAQQQNAQCENTRKLLNTIEGERFYGVDKDGNAFDVSRDDARKYAQELQKYLQENC